MTKQTYANIALTLTFIATATAIIIVLLPLTGPFPKPLTLPTKTNMDGRIPILHQPVFEHIDTGMQMTFFGTAGNDYYYLQSIHDLNWTWTGTHEEFTTQFRRTDPPPQQNETPQ